MAKDTKWNLYGKKSESQKLQVLALEYIVLRFLHTLSDKISADKILGGRNFVR